MAIRNTVSIEFTVHGPGLAQIDAIAARLRGLGTHAAPGVAGINRVTQSVHGLTGATGKAVGGLQRVGEIMLGTFGGNVLANIFTTAAAAAVSFGKSSVEAALSAEQALIVLRTQSKLTGTDLAENIELAKRVAKDLKVSDTAGLQVATGAIKAAGAAGRGQDAEKFLKNVADLAAAAGRPMSDLQEIFRQIGSGDIGAEAAFDKILGGKNPSQIYDEVAKSLGRAADSFTPAEKAQIRFNAVLEAGAKVQGIAAESLDSTTGRISALSAAYDNIQTRLGKLIIDSALFQRGLEALEKAAGALDKPETLAGLNKMATLVDAGKSGIEILVRGFGILKAEATLFGEQFGAIWDLLGSKVGNFFTQIGLDFRAIITDALLGIVRFVNSLPKALRDNLGLSGLSGQELEGRLVGEQQSLVAQKQNLAISNSNLDAGALDRIAKAQIAFAAEINRINTDPFSIGDLGASASQVAKFGGVGGAAAGAFAADFRLVPGTVAVGDSLQSAMVFERVVKAQTAEEKALGAKIEALNNTMEEGQKNPAFARVEFVAGENTLIKSVVPTGGAGQP